MIESIMFIIMMHTKGVCLTRPKDKLGTSLDIKKNVLHFMSSSISPLENVNNNLLINKTDSCQIFL